MKILFCLVIYMVTEVGECTRCRRRFVRGWSWRFAQGPEPWRFARELKVII